MRRKNDRRIKREGKKEFDVVGMRIGIGEKGWRNGWKVSGWWKEGGD